MNFQIISLKKKQILKKRRGRKDVVFLPQHVMGGGVE
jgi:hypothetical protein